MEEAEEVPEREASNRSVSTTVWNLWETRKDNPWFVSAYLVVSVGLTMFDVVSDGLVVARWWNKDGFHLYAEVALGILIVASVFSFFSFLFLPYYLCSALWSIYKGNPPSQQMDPTADGENEFGRNIGFYKLLEFMFESCPQLFLQAYVVTYEYYRDGARVQPLLQASLTLSVLAIATGIANNWLWNEGFVGYCLGGLYFGAMIVARFAVFAGLFVEFGKFAWVAVVFVLSIRFCVGICVSPDDFGIDGVDDFIYFFIFSFLGVFAYAIGPLGGRILESEDKYTSLVALFSTTEFDATIDNALHSPLGKFNYSLHFLENGVLFIILMLSPSRSKRVDVDNAFLALFVFLPMMIGSVCFFASFLPPKRLGPATELSATSRLSPEIPLVKIDEAKIKIKEI